MIRSLGGNGILDVERERDRIPCAVETRDEGAVLARRESRSSMPTQDLVEKHVQSLQTTGRFWIQRFRADRSGRLGGQHDRGTCGDAHPQSIGVRHGWRRA